MCRDNGDWKTHHEEANRDESTDTARRIRESWTSVERPHEAIVEAIATATGRDPLALDPLYDAVAVDALDALVTGAADPDRSDIRVSFFHDGVTIRIDGDGAFTVTRGRPERG